MRRGRCAISCTVQPLRRSEIFGPQRFAQERCTPGDSRRAARATSHAAIFYPRRLSNSHTLRELLRFIGVQSSCGYDISPAAELLLDSFI